MSHIHHYIGVPSGRMQLYGRIMFQCVLEVWRDVLRTWEHPQRELEQPSSFYEVFPDTNPRNTHRIATQTIDASDRPPLIGPSEVRRRPGSP